MVGRHLLRRVATLRFIKRRSQHANYHMLEFTHCIILHVFCCLILIKLSDNPIFWEGSIKKHTSYIHMVILVSEAIL